MKNGNDKNISTSKYGHTFLHNFKAETQTIVESLKGSHNGTKDWL